VLFLLASFWPGKPVEYPQGWPLDYVRAPDRASFVGKPYSYGNPKGASGLSFVVPFRSSASFESVAKELEAVLKSKHFSCTQEIDNREFVQNLPIKDRLMSYFKPSRSFFPLQGRSYVSADRKFRVSLNRMTRDWLIQVKEFVEPIDPSASEIQGARPIE